MTNFQNDRRGSGRLIKPGPLGKPVLNGIRNADVSGRSEHRGGPEDRVDLRHRACKAMA